MKSEWSDKVFDAFVQEMVTGQHPPDLTARITDAWQRQQVGEIPRSAESHAKSKLVAPPIATINSSNPSSNNPSPSIAAQRSSKPHDRNFYRWSAVLFVAASIVLVIAGLQLRNLFISATDADNMLANSTNKATSPITPSEIRRAEKIPRPLANNGEKLSLDSVPFASQEQSQAAAEKRQRATSNADSKLDDQQIVELIDTQLVGLWSQLKLIPSNRASDEELAQAISRTLTGQDLPVATAAQFAQLNSVQQREKVIAAAIDSNAFARRWADKFVSQWLRGGRFALDSEPVEKLERFVASGISDERPWNEVIAQVVAGETAAGDAFAAALAGGDNHRLATNISSQFMDSSLACARCHASTNAGSVAQTQDEYWSLVALLVGIDVASTEGSAVRESVDKQPALFADAKVPSLFFERPDGTLEAAKFILPDGRPWQSIEGQNTPRAALAKWLGQSLQADRAVVDHVWQFAFGHSLVGAQPLMNDVGFAEREDLLQLMAQQFRAHGRNLSQLVGWVIRSDAFARSEIALDQSRWLQASDDEIAKWHVAEMTFAAKTSLGKSTAMGNSGLEGSLASALKWNQSSGVDTRVLAQPNLDPKAKPNAQVKSDVLMPAPSYIVHRGRVSAAQQEFLDRLLASEKLSWKQKVEHVVALSPGLTTSNRVVRLADQLMQAKDPRTALLELLWAVQNANASLL